MICTDSDHYVNTLSTIKKEAKKKRTVNDSFHYFIFSENLSIKAHVIDTSQFICKSNKLTGLYVMTFY